MIAVVAVSGLGRCYRNPFDSVVFLLVAFWEKLSCVGSRLSRRLLRVPGRFPVPKLPPCAVRRQLREAAGESQELVAYRCGVSQRSVSFWEAGNDPSGERAERYAALLAEWAARL